MTIFSGLQGLLLQQLPQLEDELSWRGGVVLWQVEPAQGPCGTVARDTVAYEQIRLDWFGLLGKK